jgi:hypothetical protein
MLISE